MKPKIDEKDWLKTDFVLSKEQRTLIESYLEENYPDLFSSFYRELGIFLQGLEGNILLKAMVSLLDQGIPSLPIHDALYVQARSASQAKEALESSWMEEVGVGFRPVTKLDYLSVCVSSS